VKSVVKEFAQRAQILDPSDTNKSKSKIDAHF
jgi:hypothetical protein